jgi:predicted SnoaL-like aldol condensation-catalyzing enzyme
MRKFRAAALAGALTVATVSGLGAAAAAASATPSRGGGVASNEREVRLFLRTVLDEHHGDQASRFLTRDAAWHGGTVGTVEPGKNVAGLFASVVTALPNIHADLKDIFGQGNQVVVRLVVSGTQKGAILGIPASNRNIHWDAVDVFRLEHGKISAVWAGDDWSAILYYTGTYKAPWIK